MQADSSIQSSLARERAPRAYHTRVPYGFFSWNSPLAQREIWGAPKLYEWQEMVLGYFAKSLHTHAVLSTPNESGKTQVVVPLLGLAAMAAFPGCTVYSTAGAEAQIKLQLFEYLKSYCKPFEKAGWVVNQSQLSVTAPSQDGMPPSRWIGRVPRDALTAEGFHETWEKDASGRWRFRPLLMIADEAKSLDDPVFEMMMRLRPTWVLALSTPDTDSGPFYRAMNPEEVQGRGVERRGFKYISDERNYWGLRVMVTAEACAHLLTAEKVREADAVRAQMGENHRLYRSMVMGMFTAEDGDDKLYKERDVMAVINSMKRSPTPDAYLGDAHAGFDVSPTGDGDPKVIYIAQGKVVLPAYSSSEDDGVLVAKWAVDILRKHGVEPRNCRVDAGGSGKTTVDIMETVFNYRGIDRYMNNQTARFSDEFYDRFTEDSMGVRQLFHEIEICLPDDKNLLEEIKTRKIIKNYNDHGRVKMQKKKDHRKENAGKSPDRLDALTMCLAGRVVHGLARYEKRKEALNGAYDEKKTRSTHFAEKKLQDENARGGGMMSWGVKAARLIPR